MADGLSITLLILIWVNAGVPGWLDSWKNGCMDIWIEGEGE